MKRLFCSLLILILIINPAAGKVTPTGIYEEAGIFEFPSSTSGVYNATAGQAIGSIVFYDIPVDTTVNFILQYGTSGSISGQIIYESVMIGISRSTITIGTNTSIREFIDTQSFGQMKVSGYAKDDIDNTKGFAVWDGFYGVWSDQIAYVPIANLENNLVHSVSYTSTKAIPVTFSYGDETYMAEQATKTGYDVVSDWVNFAVNAGKTLYEIVTSLYYWGKFFLWDNLGMTIAIYIVITGAMAFNQSKDIFQALKKFFGYQESLYTFILKMWQHLVDLISSFRNIFRI